MKTLGALVLEINEIELGIRAQLRNRPSRKASENHFTTNAVYRNNGFITSESLLQNTEDQVGSVLKRNVFLKIYYFVFIEQDIYVLFFMKAASDSFSKI